MKARWSNAETGTFLSIDPLVASQTDPQSYNAYAYARNNPIALVDPDGKAFMQSAGSVVPGTGRADGEGSMEKREDFEAQKPHDASAGWNKWKIAAARAATLNAKRATTPDPAPEVDSSTDELSGPIPGVTRGLGPNSASFLANTSNVDAIADAHADLSRSQRYEFGKNSTVGTAIIPGKENTPPSTGTAQSGHVRGETGVVGVRSAQAAGASAIVVRLPAWADNTSVSRGAAVPNALRISAANGGIPVFIIAPRGSLGTALAVEFTGTRDSPRGRIAPVRFR